MADIVVMSCLLWWIFGNVGHANAVFLYLPLVTSAWLVLADRFPGRSALAVAWCFPLLWFLSGNRLAISDWHGAHVILLLGALLMLLVFSSMIRVHEGTTLSKIDVLLASYTGNTGHFTGQFMRGAREAGSDLRVHRFHYFKNFQAVLDGNALVVAFPIIGCKPPWPLLAYLYRRLPNGKGKPAFILYTCIGGAENAGILVWLILTLKGYRVVGRNWTIYPINVATFRLGPRKLWRWLDSLTPVRNDLQDQIRCGYRFASGQRTGIPFIFGLTPAFLVGMLIDNRWLDRLLYHNHVRRRKCTQCGICVDYCPANRLRMMDGFPKAEGDCMICLGCVNVCPENAMHIWGVTEYGQPYSPKYPTFVVRKQTSSADQK